MKIFMDGDMRIAVSRMFPIWESLGHKVVNNYKGADVQLSVVSINTKKGIPTVLRLDGIYYDKEDNYKTRNFNISVSHSVADAVVYQSNVSKIMCERYLSKRKTKIFDIIYNGVCSNVCNNFRNDTCINIVSCAKWRRWKRLNEIIEVFNNFLKYYPTSKLHIVGPMKRGSQVIKHKNIIYHNPKGMMSFSDILKLYKNMDLYLHLAKKDPCPSTVVEAIGSGIPVITTNACGGATEMCELTAGCVVVQGELESYDPDYLYKDPYNVIPKEVKKEMVEHMCNLIQLNQKVVLPEQLTIEHVAKKYIEIMKKVVK